MIANLSGVSEYVHEWAGPSDQWWRQTIKPTDNFAVDLGAESVQSVELVAMFEEEFGIEMNEDAALSVETVGGATEFITKVCQEQGVDA